MWLLDVGLIYLPILKAYKLVSEFFLRIFFTDEILVKIH